MTKNEFLAKLKEALANDLSDRTVTDNINYYNQYIDGETAKGRDEYEVVSELGDPWAIAKTISDTEDLKSGGSKTNNTYNESYSRSGSEQQPNSAGSNTSGNGGRSAKSFFSTFLTVLLVVVIIVFVISIVGGLFRVILPFILPIIFIVIVFRIFFKRR
ncbi:MAG: DUF1700 domain-containing protein [Suipraeoptans sp.]